MARFPGRSSPGYWEEDHTPTPADSPQSIEVDVTENPVVRVLLGPKGETLRQVRERPPFGYRLR